MCEPHGYADAQQERTEAPEGPAGRPPTKYHRRRNDFPGGGPPHSIPTRTPHQDDADDEKQNEGDGVAARANGGWD
ncbi:hypothetical protein JCM18882A_33540 [Brevibacterium metallidurans]|uniref:Uncharacterized protein n=1 Tax=Brevibacterium metallidurans TaxID=1482676 RepID=A0ABP3CE23_9MICO